MAIAEEEISDFSAATETMPSERGTFRTLSAPVTLQWELTSYCNERCVHCYLSGREPDTDQMAAPDVWDKASQAIVDNKVFNVTATGGEPLSVLKLAYPYLQRLKEAGVGLSFNSNLTMLTPEKCQMLRDLGVRSLLTSLMSHDPELNDRLANRPNTHHDVSRGIRLALEEGFSVTVNMVVSKNNLHDIFPTAEYVKSLGVKAFAATKAATPTGLPEFANQTLSKNEFGLMIEELLRAREILGLTTDSLEFYPMCAFDTQDARDFTGNRMCSAGKSTCTIGFDGEVRPCSHASQIYGNVQENGSLAGSWRNLQPWRTIQLIPTECDRCSVRNICRGGCRSEAFATSGKLNAPNPDCDFTNPVLPRSPLAQRDINLSANFRFHPKVKYREEDFGGILYRNPAKWVCVTSEMLDFYKVTGKERFGLAVLANALRVDKIEDVAATAKELIGKQILNGGGDKNG